MSDIEAAKEAIEEFDLAIMRWGVEARAIKGGRKDGSKRKHSFFTVVNTWRELEIPKQVDTLTSHHTAEIAKRDRAIEVLRAGLKVVRCEDDNAQKMVFAVLDEAQAILGGTQEPNA